MAESNEDSVNSSSGDAAAVAAALTEEAIVADDRPLKKRRILPGRLLSFSLLFCTINRLTDCIKNRALVPHWKNG